MCVVVDAKLYTLMSASFLQPVYVNASPTEVAFNVLTRREVELLSIGKLTQARVYDELGHPVPGGLDDARMGPHRDFDVSSLFLSSSLDFPLTVVRHMPSVGQQLWRTYWSHRAATTLFQSYAVHVDTTGLLHNSYATWREALVIVANTWHVRLLPSTDRRFGKCCIAIAGGTSALFISNQFC